MNTNERTIRRFYDAFASGDAATMGDCYHPDATFNDPAFGNLDAEGVRRMWSMLISNSKGKLAVSFDNVQADELEGAATWTAAYTFSKTNRQVVNRVQARFTFKDGLILDHRDHFDFWKWSRQAFGAIGFLMGWTGYFQRKVRTQALSALRRYQEKTNTEPAGLSETISYDTNRNL